MTAPRPRPDAPPTAPPGSPHDPALAPAGRLQTFAALLALYSLSILPPVAALWQGAPADARSLLYAGLTALLLVWVWQGSVWAWRLTVAFSVVAGLLIFLGGMLVAPAGAAGWLVSFVGLAYIGLGLALVGAPAIRAYLDGRWAARARRTP